MEQRDGVILLCQSDHKRLGIRMVPCEFWQVDLPMTRPSLEQLFCIKRYLELSAVRAVEVFCFFVMDPSIFRRVGTQRATLLVRVFFHGLTLLARQTHSSQEKRPVSSGPLTHTLASGDLPDSIRDARRNICYGTPAVYAAPVP